MLFTRRNHMSEIPLVTEHNTVTLNDAPLDFVHDPTDPSNPKKGTFQVTLTRIKNVGPEVVLQLVVRDAHDSLISDPATCTITVGNPDNPSSPSDYTFNCTPTVDAIPQYFDGWLCLLDAQGECIDSSVSMKGGSSCCAKT
jgi:hypothetical protein